MAFMIIKFEVLAGQEQLLQRLSCLDCFRIVGDWHEHRLQIVRAAGLSNDSAPARSVIDDRDRNGGSLHVSILLANGPEMTGQLRKSSLLVSNAAITPETVADDPNVGKVVSCFRKCVGVRSVEVG